MKDSTSSKRHIIDFLTLLIRLRIKNKARDQSTVSLVHIHSVRDINSLVPHEKKEDTRSLISIIRRRVRERNSCMWDHPGLTNMKINVQRHL